MELAPRHRWVRSFIEMVAETFAQRRHDHFGMHETVDRFVASQRAQREAPIEKRMPAPFPTEGAAIDTTTFIRVMVQEGDKSSSTTPDDWFSAIAIHDTRGTTAAICAPITRRTISAHLGEDVVAGWHEEVSPYQLSMPGTLDSERLYAMDALRDVVWGRRESTLTHFDRYDYDPVACATPSILGGTHGGEDLMISIFARALRLTVVNAFGERRWTKIWPMSIARTPEGATAALANERCTRGRPGDPCELCGGTLVDPEARTIARVPTAGDGDYDFVRAMDIDLVCGTCGVRFRTALCRTTWLDGSGTQYG